MELPGPAPKRSPEEAQPISHAGRIATVAKEVIVEVALETMETQLGVWAVEIESLTAGYLKFGTQSRFDTLIYLDELRCLHAIARSNLDVYRTAGATERAELEPGLRADWDDLVAAMKRQPPTRKSS